MNNLQRSKILCLGNIAYDLIPDGMHPDKGPFSLKAIPGGSVLNTAIHLSRLGADVSVAARTGSDPLGRHLFDVLGAENIDTSRISPDKRVKTALAIAEIDCSGNSNYYFYRPTGKKIRLPRKYLSKRSLKGYGAIHTGSAFSYSDHSCEDAFSAMETAGDNGMIASFDPNWREGRLTYPARAKKRIKKLIACSTLLKLSDNDAISITGKKTLSSALSVLPNGTVVTRGEKGALLLLEGKQLKVPAFPVKVMDTIGAGDAFSAGLIFRLISTGRVSGKELEKNDLVFASAVSSLICTGNGAVSGLKDLSDILYFLEERGYDKML